MSSIVYQTDKKTGAKYAYESVSYWDKEKKQPRSKRKYLGRVDPDTGEIIPKGERMGKRLLTPADDSILREQLLGKEKEIKALREEVSLLQRENKRLYRSLREIQQLVKENLEGQE